MDFKLLLLSRGIGVNIEIGVYFGKVDAISIGGYSGVGRNSMIYKYTIIAKDRTIGGDILIVTDNYEFTTTDVPMTQQGYQPFKPISIGDDICTEILLLAA